jgi:phosphosulfolactate synthase
MEINKKYFMNVTLPYLPDRPLKPRNSGITMVMDKGLSLNEAKNFIEKAGVCTDWVKLGFGTSVFAPRLKEKINLYKAAEMRPYIGGTLFEAYAVRNMIDEYLRFLDSVGIDMCEVSDGSMAMEHDIKLECIAKISRYFTVVSEVGSKQKDVVIPDNKWVEMMMLELNAGSWKVIAEAREGGNTGIYNSDKTANTGLIGSILKNMNVDDILWEAPVKDQQVWFIKQYGPNVNLGNIAPDDVVPLECLRQGLRGDTFNDFMQKSQMCTKPEVNSFLNLRPFGFEHEHKLAHDIEYFI